jgi:hypothetical protein
MRILVFILLFISVGSANCQSNVTLPLGRNWGALRSSINSIPPTTYTALHPNGFNEFDIITDDVTGDYEIVYDARSYIGYRRFHTASELQSAAETVILSGSHYYFPSLLKESGIYYLYYHNESNDIHVISSATIAGLSSATPVLVASGCSDFSVRKSPTGTYVASGYIGSHACIWTSPTPTGTFTLQGYVYGDPNTDVTQPSAYSNQADGYIFFDRDSCYYMFNGWVAGRTGTPSTSHDVIFPIDTTTWRATRWPIEFIHQFSRSFHSQFDSGFIYNPVFVNHNGYREIWYVGSSSDTGYIARMPVLGITNLDTLPNTYKLLVRNTDSTELVSNRYNIYTTGGIYNFLNSSYLLYGVITCQYTATSLPDSTGLLFSIGNVSSTHMKAYVNSASELWVDFTTTAGNWSYKVKDISLNVRDTLTISIAPVLGVFLGVTINGSNKGSFPGSFTSLDTYSLYNTQTDIHAAGSQFHGIIHELKNVQSTPFIIQ